jgi:hypothetical protein
MASVRATSSVALDEMTTMGRRQGLATALFVAWLCSAAAGLWWFEWEQPRADLKTVAFDPEHFELGGLSAKARDKVLVLALTDPDCKCALRAAQRSGELRRRFRAQEVEFAEILPPWLSPGASNGHEWDQAELRSVLWRQIPASPAALVLTPGGAVAYLGPWNSPEWCSTGTDDLLDRTIAAAAARRAMVATPMLATSCFCSARRTETINTRQVTG